MMDGTATLPAPGRTSWLPERHAPVYATGVVSAATHPSLSGRLRVAALPGMAALAAGRHSPPGCRRTDKAPRSCAASRLSHRPNRRSRTVSRYPP